MKFGPDLYAPTLLQRLEAAGVELWEDAGDLCYESTHKLTDEEIGYLREHKAELLDLLLSRELLRDNSEDVLPALRAYLSEHPHAAYFEPHFLKLSLYIFSYLERIPSQAEVAAALVALDIERGAA
jgi:hypothetical protein